MAPYTPANMDSMSSQMYRYPNQTGRTYDYRPFGDYRGAPEMPRFVQEGSGRLGGSSYPRQSYDSYRARYGSEGRDYNGGSYSGRGDFQYGGDYYPRGDFQYGGDYYPRGDFQYGGYTPQTGSLAGGAMKDYYGGSYSGRGDYAYGGDYYPRSDFQYGGDYYPRGDFQYGGDYYGGYGPQTGGLAGGAMKNYDAAPYYPRGDFQYGSDYTAPYYPRGDFQYGGDYTAPYYPRGDFQYGSDYTAPYYPRGDFQYGGDYYGGYGLQNGGMTGGAMQDYFGAPYYPRGDSLYGGEYTPFGQTPTFGLRPGFGDFGYTPEFTGYGQKNWGRTGGAMKDYYGGENYPFGYGPAQQFRPGYTSDSGSGFAPEYPVYSSGWMGDYTGYPITTGRRYELREVDGEYVCICELPGFERSDIECSYEDGVFYIDAYRDGSQDSDNVWMRRSRRVSERVPLPRQVAVDDITASYRKGVLEVRMPYASGDARNAQVINIRD
ncbi:Hsp20/alpha crystallin family protein [Haloarchaeobius sp. DT45]|uniref:Hsp20/alpha crystallin family protein n=1 Tax=Haloarchaeobius sp. DT45 TaxID=3446116 RepID=UPI003F6B6E84